MAVQKADRFGELPAVKIGGRGQWRVDRTKLDTYLDNPRDPDRRVGQGPPPESEGEARPGPRRAGLKVRLRVGRVEARILGLPDSR